MDVLRTIEALHAWRGRARAGGRRVGFVPTMGCLHEGHLSLIQIARRHSDAVLVSIFVNPAQFGPGEDFKTYPRDFDRDEARCRETGAEAVFYPDRATMYTPDHSVYVEETHLSQTLCGASRPGHFRGVCTVVAKLFNLVQPDVAVFGRKDAQQLRIIEQMVRDLNFPVEIIPGPIIREPDGLAMSSRNQRLSPGHRKEAVCLKRALEAASDRYTRGECNAETLRNIMRSELHQAPSARIDYAEIVDYRSFAPVEKLSTPALAAVAVYFNDVRLIDNVRLG